METKQVHVRTKCGLFVVAVALFCSLLVMGTGRDAEALTCSQGTLVGTVCVIVTAPPTLSPATCPISSTVVQDASGQCFALTAPISQTSCPTPFQPFGSQCVVQNPATDPAAALLFTCPTSTAMVNASMATFGPNIYIVECSTQMTVTLSCAPGSVLDANDFCRSPIQLVPGTLVCSPGSTLVPGNTCVRYVLPIGMPMVVSNSYFVPLVDPTVTVAYELACASTTTVRFSAFEVTTVGGARADLITLNGSVALSLPIDTSGQFDLVVIPGHPNDTVVLDGPADLPDCANWVRPPVNSRSTNGPTNPR